MNAVTPQPHIQVRGEAASGAEIPSEPMADPCSAAAADRDALLPLEDFSRIKQLFEVFSFARMRHGQKSGFSTTTTTGASPSPTPAGRPDNLVRQARQQLEMQRKTSFDVELYGQNAVYDVDGRVVNGVCLPPLRRDDAVWGPADYRRSVFDLHEGMRDDTKLECGLTVGRKRGPRVYDFAFFAEFYECVEPPKGAVVGRSGANSHTESEPSSALTEPCTPSYPPESITGFREYLSKCQSVLDAEIEAMETWKRQQRLLRGEALAERARVQATGSLIGSNMLTLPNDVVPLSAAVPLQFFALYVASPYLRFLLPDLCEEIPGVDDTFDLPTTTERERDEPQPWRPRHLHAVQSLFRMIDTDADDLVSWDEFCSYVLNAAQQRYGAGSAMVAAAGRSGGNAAPTTDRVMKSTLVFTPTPTNYGLWQTNFPLVHHLSHREPISKLLISEGSRRYITAGSDGLVKLWKADSRLCDAQNRPAIVHDRNLLFARSGITGVALSSPLLGDSEVTAVTAMDGTVTLLRMGTGEVVRTLMGFKGASEEEVSAAIWDLRSRTGMDIDKKEFEADDLLSLRTRNTGVSGAVVRLPYTIRAYHDDAMEIFFGKTNQYFHGLTVMAPTYEHLLRPVTSASDVLYCFGAEKLVSRAGAGAPKCWFATSTALCRYTWNTTHAPVSTGAYIVLGFEAGIIQFYPVNDNWFCVNQISATRVEPPSARFPAYSSLFHRSTVNCIFVSEASDLLITASDDGTAQIRTLSRLDVPLLALGQGVLTTPADQRPRQRASGFPTVERLGHTKRIVCSCWNEKHHVFVTGGMDYAVFFWNARSARPLRWIDLRDDANTPPEMNLGACGHPVDVSFMERLQDPLRLIVLDNRRVIRLFDAHTCALMKIMVDTSPESLAQGEMLLARYEPEDDRLILGGMYLRVWDVHREEEYAPDYTGHSKPVLFMAWHDGLQAYLTADEDQLCVWRLAMVPYKTAIDQRHQRIEARGRAIKKAREVAKRHKLLQAAQRVKDQAQGSRCNGDIPLEEDAGGPMRCDPLDPPRSLPPSPVRAHSMASLGAPEELDDDAFARTIVFAPELAHEFPTVDCLNRFNQTYWSGAATLLRAWMVREGILAVSVMPCGLAGSNSSTSGGIFVALRRERAVVQYNPFNAAILRRFSFPGGCTDLIHVCADQSILSCGAKVPSPLMCAVFEQSPTAGVASIYHLLDDGMVGSGSDGGTPTKRDDEQSGRQQSAEPKVRTASTEVGTIPPHRNLIFKECAVTSLAILPTAGILAIGGRHTLYTTTIADMTNYATPCQTLEQRQRLTAKGKDNLTLPDNMHTSSTIFRPASRTQPLDLVALFPGHLVPRPVETATVVSELMHSVTHVHRPSRHGSMASVLRTSSASISVRHASIDRPRVSETTGFIEETHTCGLGFLGHLLPVCGTDYIISGSNDGVVSVWSVRSVCEILRFTASVCNDTITCLILSSMQNNCQVPARAETRMPAPKGSDVTHRHASSPLEPYYVAVGDQAGFILLLDLHGIPWTGDEHLDKHDRLWEEVVVLDRWRAHRQDVRGISFIHNPLIMGGEEAIGQAEAYGSGELTWHARGNPTSPRRDPVRSHALTIVTSGEDSYVFVWRWRAGVLHCLGCFGGGPKTPVEPPLAHPPLRVIQVYETARRQYVLMRLVHECGYFLSRASSIAPTELDSALAFMKQEAETFIADTERQWELALGGSMAFHDSFFSKKLIQRRELSVDESFRMGPPRETESAGFLPPAATIFDKAGMDGVLYRLQAQRESQRSFRRSGSGEVAAVSMGSSGASTSTPRFHCTPRAEHAKTETSLSSGLLVLVFAFMCGTYPDLSARDCLRRTVGEVRPHIKKLRKEMKKAQRRPSYVPSLTSHIGVGLRRPTEGPSTQNSRSASRDSEMAADSMSALKLTPHSPLIGPHSPVAVLPETFPNVKSAEAVSQTAVCQREAAASPPSSPPNGLRPLTAVHRPTSQDAAPTSDLGRGGGPSPMTEPRQRLISAAGTESLLHFSATEEGTLLPLECAMDVTEPELSTQSPSPVNVESAKAGGCDPPVETIRLRGVAVPHFKVRFGNDNALLRPSSPQGAEPPSSGYDESGGKYFIADVPPRLPPKIIAAPYRHRAVHGSPVDAIATQRLSPEADGRKGRMRNGDAFFAQQEEDPNRVLEEGGAAAVIQFTYLNRRRDEAVQRLMEVQQHELEGRLFQQRTNRKLAVEAGLVGLASYGDFSATGMSSVFFGAEKLLLDAPPEDPNHRIIGAAFMQDIMHRKSGAPAREVQPAEEEELDWYTARELMKRKRKNAEALWAPSRVMATLMDWDSPIPPHGRPSSAEFSGQMHRLYKVEGSDDGEGQMEPAGNGELSRPASSQEVCLLRDHVTNLTAAGHQRAMPLSIPPILVGANFNRLPARVLPPRAPTVAVEDEEALQESHGLEAAAAAAADKLLRPEKKGINLNALVASEVDAMREIMRQSILERESLQRKVTSGNAGDSEDPRESDPAHPEDSSTSGVDDHQHAVSVTSVASSARQQPSRRGMRTQRLFERRRRRPVSHQ